MSLKGTFILIKLVLRVGLEPTSQDYKTRILPDKLTEQKIKTEYTLVSFWN